MKLHIENINKIKTADIKLNGLTIIAGENDTGKSTVSKVLFSTIKALANTRHKDEGTKKELLEKHIASLYKRLNSKSLRKDNPNLSKLFPAAYLFEKTLSEFNFKTEILNFIERRMQFVNDELDMIPRSKELLLQDLDNIRILLTTDSRSADLATELCYFIESEFMNKISSSSETKSIVELSLENKESDKVIFEISNNRARRVKCKMSDDLLDATYVESPLYLHVEDAIRKTTTYRETNSMLFPMVPIHIKDFSDKMENLRLGVMEKDGTIVQRIHSVAGGSFRYDNNAKSITFEKEGKIFSPINIASGIKSFGVLQILLQTKAISANAPLLWDEPENHLHPGWQVNFAEIFVQLVKSGIPIVVSTHSPYFIQAIRYFSAKYEVEKYVNYYLAEEDTDGLSVIEEVTTDLNRVFTKLAQPLDKIMNISEAYKQKQK